jgi:two-component system LytT family response regulator
MDGAPYPRLIPVRSVGRVTIVHLRDIVRLEAADNYVRLWADRPYLVKQTFQRVVARLDPELFLRVHRSHAVNLQRVRELKPRHHGEYTLTLADGSEIVTGRSYRDPIQARFGLT